MTQSGRAKTTLADKANTHCWAGLPCRKSTSPSILNDKYAWDMQGDTPVPLTSLYLDGVPYADLRLLEIAITPHGFLKMALAAKDATAISLPINGPSDFGLSHLAAR